MWVVSFIFYGLIVCLLVSLAGIWLAQLLGSIVAVTIKFVLFVSKLLSELPMSALYTSNIYAVVWLIGAYGLLILFLCQRKKQPMLLLTGVVFTFLLTNGLSWSESMNDDFRVTMLDVGQGQSILLQSDGKAFLVDCGGDYDAEAADAAAEHLLSQGISRLDGIILTHYDDDHAGGVENLLTRIRCDRLLLPYIPEDSQRGEQLAAQAEGLVEFIHSDQIYTFGQTQMTIFAPISSASGNESSICILFQRQDCAILITGDRGFAGEAALLSHHDLPDVKILVAGHHGSAGSTSEALLEETNPDYVWISVGEDNPYGHPADALLFRLSNCDCEIYRTDIHGTIIFRR